MSEHEGLVQRAIAVLEFVASEGGASARHIAEGTNLPLPTVYRLLGELCEADYLVHLRQEKRFALGYRLHSLAVRLHEDLGLAPEVRRAITDLHTSTQMAAYLAIHRGTDFVVVYVADSPICPRIQPMGFGFRDCPHATAFGKLGLAVTDVATRTKLLAATGLPQLTQHTITDDEVLQIELGTITKAGVAWEHEEFQAGTSCAAVPIFSSSGSLIGSVAVSAPSEKFRGKACHVEHLLRSTAARAGRYYRLGSVSTSIDVTMRTPASSTDVGARSH